jgi:hypothetical protein
MDISMSMAGVPLSLTRSPCPPTPSLAVRVGRGGGRGWIPGAIKGEIYVLVVTPLPSQKMRLPCSEGIFVKGPGVGSGTRAWQVLRAVLALSHGPFFASHGLRQTS